MPKPIAFMVMPFAKKRPGLEGSNAPPEVDFDRLWYQVHEPVLAELGYQPVRADQDVGALIVVEMIQRLTMADLVVADVSLPNANVYYEIGVRHAAKRFGCVLVAASWAQPVFDLAQMRQLRYALVDGKVGDEASDAARRSLLDGLRPLLEGESPVFSAVPGYPADAAEADLSAFRDVMDELLAFNAEVRRIPLLPTKAERAARAREVVQRHGHRPVLREAVALELIHLLRDHVGWSAMLAYIDALPSHLHRHPMVIEQRCLGLAKDGDPASAVGLLEELIGNVGGTSERWGILGGRYKELRAAAASERDRRRFLGKAIEAYEHGMLADLNDYYPASNLARLYRARVRDGDQRKAADAEAVTAVALERAIAVGTADEWARPTLLGLAFDRGDVVKARELRDEVADQGAPAWMHGTTLRDLQASLAHHSEPVREALAGVLVELTELAEGDSGGGGDGGGGRDDIAGARS